MNKSGCIPLEKHTGSNYFVQIHPNILQAVAIHMNTLGMLQSNPEKVSEAYLNREYLDCNIFG